MNIGDTAHTASAQPVCDVSNCEHLLTPGKPFHATLSPVRIYNRKQQQSLAQVRKSQKRFTSQIVFSRHKNDARITLAANESACRISRKQAATGVSHYTLMSPRDSSHCDQGNLDGDISGTFGAFARVLRGLSGGFERVMRGLHIHQFHHSRILTVWQQYVINRPGVGLTLAPYIELSHFTRS